MKVETKDAKQVPSDTLKESAFIKSFAFGGLQESWCPNANGGQKKKAAKSLQATAN